MRSRRATWRVPDPRSEADRGAVIVILALVLVALMTFAAFAVDLGLGYAERRADQSAADAAALGGGMELADGVQAAVDEATRLVRANLPTSYTDEEWVALWAACTDPAALPFTGTVAGVPTSCVSADGIDTFRVRVPDQTVDLLFAAVVGRRRLAVRAAAEARVAPAGGVLPFAVLASAPAGSLICLRSATNGQATPPCTGSDQGNFGALQVPQWGNAAKGTEGLPCNLNKSDQLAVNIAVGLDHFIRRWDSTDIRDDCSRQFGPNMIESFQGVSGGLWEGVVAGVAVEGRTFDGLLTRTPHATVTLKQGPRTWKVDNRPLWTFIPYGKGGDVPATCTRESIESTLATGGLAAAHAQMDACLRDYAAGGGYATLFDLDEDGDEMPDIATSPRYGVVPQFMETSFPSGNSGWLRIGDFEAVFINQLYFGCNGTSCQTVLEPGTTASTVTVPNGSQPLDQLAGHLIPTAALPSTLVANGPDGSLGPFAVRLSA